MVLSFLLQLLWLYFLMWCGVNHSDFCCCNPPVPNAAAAAAACCRVVSCPAPSVVTAQMRVCGWWGSARSQRQTGQASSKGTSCCRYGARRKEIQGCTVALTCWGIGT